MADFEVSLQGFDELAAKLKDSTIIENVARKMLSRALAIAQSVAVKEAPVDQNTLRGSLVGGSHIDGSWPNLKGILGTNVSYARYQEEGTGIYGPKASLIYPKSAKVLAFVPNGNRVNAKGGVAVFARYVRGVQAHHYMQKAFQAVKDQMDEILSWTMGQAKQDYGL